MQCGPQTMQTQHQLSVCSGICGSSDKSLVTRVPLQLFLIRHPNVGGSVPLPNLRGQSSRTTSMPRKLQSDARSDTGQQILSYSRGKKRELGQ